MVFEITKKANEFDAQPLMKRLHNCPTTQNTENCFRNFGLGTSSVMWRTLRSRHSNAVFQRISVKQQP